MINRDPEFKARTIPLRANFGPVTSTAYLFSILLHGNASCLYGSIRLAFPHIVWRVFPSNFLFFIIIFFGECVVKN